MGGGLKARVTIITLLLLSNINPNALAWNQMGPTISGEANGDWFGRHVALSADGNHMIVGAPY